MMEYKPLSELVWAKVQLKCASHNVEGVYKDRKVFDDILAVNRVLVLDTASTTDLTSSEVLWHSEKLSWADYFGVLEVFPGVKPGDQTYHSLAQLIWATYEYGFVGNPAKLKSDKVTFKFLQDACLAEVMKSHPDRSPAWKLYSSEVKLWETFGGGGNFPGTEPSQQPLLGSALTSSTTTPTVNSESASIQSISRASVKIEKPFVAFALPNKPGNAVKKPYAAENSSIQAKFASPAKVPAVPTKLSIEKSIQEHVTISPAVKVTAMTTRLPVALQKPTELPKTENRPFIPVITKDRHGIVAGKSLPPGTTSEERFARSNADGKVNCNMPLALETTAAFPIRAAQSFAGDNQVAVESASSFPANGSPTSRALRESPLKVANRSLISAAAPLGSQNQMAEKLGGLGQSRWAS